ncbi:MAG: hypothetical protein EZS28_025975 [Streblomastix strix]|uniref:Uncharacterized protein n=1 Tax=Streblomastix strix TaxID=222440 RepID=A0A5J4V729_9EUKA|nr:MAG: hypothetical protein EZS28_025975 [Streblomastix strix]
MISISKNDTADVVVNQGSGYHPMDLCDFSGSYLFDSQIQESNENGTTSNGQPISHLNRVNIQHDTFLSVPITPSVFPQYTVTEVSRDQLLALAYTPSAYLTIAGTDNLVRQHIHIPSELKADKTVGTHLTIPTKQNVDGTQSNITSPYRILEVGEEDF